MVRLKTESCSQISAGYLCHHACLIGMVVTSRRFEHKTAVVTGAVNATTQLIATDET